MNFKFGPHTIGKNQIFYCSKYSFGLVNLKPIVPGHVLVICRRVVPRFLDLTKEEVSDLFESAHLIAKQIESIHKAESLTMTIQDGSEAGQSGTLCMRTLLYLEKINSNHHSSSIARAITDLGSSSRSLAYYTQI